MSLLIKGAKVGTFTIQFSLKQVLMLKLTE